jgi:hypothetical protein
MNDIRIILKDVLYLFDSINSMEDLEKMKEELRKLKDYKVLK